MTPEQLRECPIDQCAENTDREIYRGPDDGCGDFYSDSLHITQEGALGINCGGYVIVRSIRAWHGIAKAHAAALEELARLKAPVGDVQGLCEALSHQKQCDEDGILCAVSRQAVDEAIDLIESLAAKVAELTRELSCSTPDSAYIKACEDRDRAEAALAECRTKLEVDPRTKYDGISCRDETIRLLEAALAESERKGERLKFHAEAMAKGMLDDGPANLWAAYDAYRAEFKEES